MIGVASLFGDGGGAELRLTRKAIAAMTLVLLISVGSTAVATASGDRTSTFLTASLPIIETPEPSRKLSPDLIDAINGHHLTVRPAPNRMNTAVSWREVYDQATKNSKDDLVAIAPVRITDTDYGPVDQNGHIDLMLNNRLVWLIVYRDPDPFASGPIDSPRPDVSHCSTCYVWWAVDPKSGKDLGGQTFDLAVPTTQPTRPQES
jgi:hypothetical protein